MSSLGLWICPSLGEDGWAKNGLLLSPPPGREILTLVTLPPLLGGGSDGVCLPLLSGVCAPLAGGDQLPMPGSMFSFLLWVLFS